MGNGTKRVKGKVEEIKGTLKEGVGNLIDNEHMEMEGHAKKLTGQARQDVAKAEERIKGAGEQLVGTAKGAVGRLIGNEQLRVEGKANELKGKAARKPTGRRDHATPQCCSPRAVLQRCVCVGSLARRRRVFWD
jgi:uncharacterized protein YjbJ (UPF0337 family)